ncbi:hypothetical protein R1sor_024717 [Riccia sorocarpa]|uniref:Uncharacterized protein n=1 Tax=Riccia sorocarpa TaxID=122646 RepID=A0ABD3GVD7_9MARC
METAVFINRRWSTSEWKAALSIPISQSNPLVDTLNLTLDGEMKFSKSRSELWHHFLENSHTLRSLSIDCTNVFHNCPDYMSELVSGLRRNPFIAVEKLTIIQMGSWSGEEVIVHLSEIIRRWSEDQIRALAPSIAEAIQLNLDSLSFTGTSMVQTLHGSDLLGEVLRAETDSGRRYLPELYITGDWKLFPLLAPSNISTIILLFPLPFTSTYSSEPGPQPRESLLSRGTAFDCAEALKSSPLVSLDIGLCLRSGKVIEVKAHRCSTGTLTVRDLPPQVRYTASRQFEDHLMDLFEHAFGSSSFFTKLVLLFWGVSKRWGKSFFESLKSNRSITSLDLTGCDLKDRDFEHLMSLLRVNFTVREVKLERTSWRNDGKAALIEEALARNKKLATEFSIMKGAGFEFDQAKVGRIFLCGSPYAGKTELKLCMMRLRHQRSRSASKPGKLSDVFLYPLNLLDLRRTRGAEVEVLINSKEGQVSLWDLAGQYMFRALHDLILPRTNQSLIFVFAFNPFEVDRKTFKKKYAHSKKEVKPFLNAILALINNWSKNQSVPVVCSAVSSALIAHVESSTSTSPVWSLPYFYEFCRENHENLVMSSPEILFTIASYLHDVGRIIIVPECGGPKNDEPLVIIDPNWCTETFLGAMIAEGDHFDVQGGSCSGSVVFTTSSDGFIDEGGFQSLLQTILDQMKHEGIKRSLLEDLLQRMDLCYRFEDDTSVRYFVPVICGGLGEKRDLRSRELQWYDGHTERSEYLGYRLHCKDMERTSFNKASFSRFQINFRRKFMQRFRIEESNRAISCGLGLLKVTYDGHVVLVESDEVNGQHVDIMVKSSQPGVNNPRTRMQIIRFVKEHFLQELQAFCASSTGCPGLRLIVSVIRTTSVQNLVPIHERRGPQHTVELEKLKGQFRSSIDHNLEGMAADVSEDSLLNFQYTWPDGGREFAKDALGHEDQIDILAYAREKLRRSEREVESCSKDLQRVLTILSDPSNSTLTAVEEAETSRRGASHSPTVADDNLQLLSEESKLLAAKVDEVGEKLGRKIDHLAHLTVSVYTELQEVRNLLHKFRTGLTEMQRVMTEVNSSIDKLIGYSISREDHSCPRRPYFSQKDAGVLSKVKAYVVQGQAVRLHFLCEARNQPHVVQDQRGLSVEVTQTDMSWVPYISEISLKLISTLLTAGIKIFTGMQIDTQVLQVVDRDTWKLLPMSDKLLEYLKQDGTKISVNPADHRVVQSWSLLRKHLGEHLNYGEYRKTFGLCRVRYRCTSDPYAWICESCLEKGTKQGILDECLPE